MNTQTTMKKKPNTLDQIGTWKCHITRCDGSYQLYLEKPNPQWKSSAKTLALPDLKKVLSVVKSFYK